MLLDECRAGLLDLMKELIDGMSATALGAMKVACRALRKTYKNIENTCSGCKPKPGTSFCQRFQRCLHAYANLSCNEAAAAARGSYVASGCDFVLPTNADHFKAFKQRLTAATKCASSITNNCGVHQLTNILDSVTIGIMR